MWMVNGKGVGCPFIMFYRTNNITSSHLKAKAEATCACKYIKNFIYLVVRHLTLFFLCFQLHPRTCDMTVV